MVFFRLQRLLLKDLFETRMCHSLLVCEADEDVRWAKDKYHSFHNRARRNEGIDKCRKDSKHSCWSAGATCRFSLRKIFPHYHKNEGKKYTDTQKVGKLIESEILRDYMILG